MPYGCDHAYTVCCKTDHDTRAAEDQHPYGYCRLGTDHSGLSDADDGRHGADGVGHIVGAVCECHAASGDDHQDAKHTFDRMEVLALVGLFVWRDALNCNRSDQSDANSN